MTDVTVNEEVKRVQEVKTSRASCCRFCKLVSTKPEKNSAVRWSSACMSWKSMDIHTTPVGWKVIGCAIEVHRELGPGLLESAYERGVARELKLRKIVFKRQVPLLGSYKGEDLGQIYRVDFVVEDELVVELKAASQLVWVHRAQLRTYLRTLGLRQGLLLNFNMPRLVDGLSSVLLPERERRK